MEGAPESDDALSFCDVSGQLDAGFNRLGSRVGEPEHLDSIGGDPAQVLGQIYQRVVPEDTTGVGELAELLLCSRNHFWMIVAKVGDGCPAREVRPFVPRCVVYPRTLSMVNVDICVEGQHWRDGALIPAK